MTAAPDRAPNPAADPRTRRVLHVIPAIAAAYGGPSTTLGPLVRALNRRHGWQVEVATTDAGGSGRRIDAHEAASLGVPVHLFRRGLSERWKFSPGLAAWLLRHARDFDLLHVHALWSFSTAAACAAARRSGVPVVLRPCGMLSAYTWNRSAGRKRIYWSLVEKRNLAGASRFHVTSRGEADEVLSLSLPGAPAPDVIPHGVEDAAFEVPPRPDRLREACGPNTGDRPILLFLSRLHPKKGLHDFLLPALARLRHDAFLAVAGGPDDHAPGYPAEVHAAVDRLGLRDRVAFLGAVPPADRWALFDGAAAFVLPSRAENFGVVVAEAMARGTPVVVSTEVQAGDHVIAGNAGRVVPLDVAALAQVLDDLLADSASRQSLGAAGLAYARDHFRWDEVAGRVLRMYEGCLA